MKIDDTARSDDGRLSSSIGALREWMASRSDPVLETVIIGSGYGGAVAAQRLAQANMEVAVLERGLEWQSGEFPDGLARAFGQIRIDNSAAPQLTGNETALFDLRLGQGIGALVGNALGGGSQINAGVAIEPDPRVFDKVAEGRRAWPARIGGPAMAPHFEAARRCLGAEVCSAALVGASPDAAHRPRLDVPLKTQRLRELVATMRGSAPEGSQCNVSEPLHLTIRQADPGRDTLDARGRLSPNACVGCGECVAGCNFNAKQTLTHTYLRRAEAAGARLYTGVTALQLERAGEHWCIRCVATADRQRQREGADVPELRIRARHVFVAAGALGSTELLLRSQNAGAGLGFSSRLGSRLATNGDNLAVAYLADRSVNGIGQGAAGFAWQMPGVGPTISGSLRWRNPDRLEQEVLIQDAAIPRALAGIFHELVTTSGMLAQLASWSMRPQKGNGAQHVVDWAALQTSSLARTQTLLLMGHDAALGRMERNRDSDRLRLIYPPQESRRVAAIQDRYLAAVFGAHGLLLRSPWSEPMPRTMAASLESPPWGGAGFTVHPLGGCPMGDDASTGVVDHAGRVFKAVADADGAVHPGLYVLDGSIVPSSLGVNPLLTITALAERAMSVLLREDFSVKDPVAPTAPPTTAPPMHDKKTVAAVPRHVPVHFTEVLRNARAGAAVGKRPAASGSGFEWRPGPRGRLQAADAKLVLHLPLPSLERFAADPNHVIAIPAQGTELHAIASDHEPAHLLVEQALANADQVPAVWARMHVTGGAVQLLAASSRGSWRRLDAFARTLITWLVSRGAEDAWNWLRGNTPRPPSTPTSDEAPQPWLHRLLQSGQRLLQLAWHCSEVRTMRYTLQLRDSAAPVDSGFSHELVGQKSLGYPATWGQILGLLTPPSVLRLCQRLLSAHGQPGSPGEWLPRLGRTNVWMSLSEMDVRVFDRQRRLVGRGCLGLDLIDMSRLHAPQLGLRGNTPDALIALAGYPLWMLRFLLKTRLWDFRLPDYPTHRPPELNPNSSAAAAPVPGTDEVECVTAWPGRFPPLRVPDPQRPGGRCCVNAHVFDAFDVPLSREQPEKRIWLRLIRYPHSSVAMTQDQHGVRRFKSILLLNGFAQSTLPFVAEELKPENGDSNLAAWLHQQGFDVWLFEYRTSAILESSKLPCSMDDIAANDIPAAVDRVLDHLRKENGLRSDEPAQIHAFAHCVGGASLAMSLLGGRLQYRRPDDGAELNCGKLASVVFSQMHLYLVGSASAQARLGLSALARDALGIKYFRLSAAERQATPFESVLDRLFASLPVEPEQECPHERFRFAPHPDTCTCKRMTGIVSRLIHHPRILAQTHERLPIYYGRANTSLLVHGSRCVEHERLVNADGQNTYVTEDNIQRYLDLPIALLHGDQNALFDVESAHRTMQQLERLHSALCRQGLMRTIIAKDFGHFDCTIGHGAPMREQILDPIARFLKDAWAYDRPLEPPHGDDNPKTTRVRAPAAGPVIGWTRRAPPDYGKSGWLVRLWIEIDESSSDRADRALTRIEPAGEAMLWPVLRVPVATWPAPPVTLAEWARPMVPHEPYICMALADVFIADEMLNARAPIAITMVSVHEYEPGDARPRTDPIGRPGSGVYSSPGVAVTGLLRDAIAASNLGSPKASAPHVSALDWIQRFRDRHAGRPTDLPWWIGMHMDDAERQSLAKCVDDLRAQEQIRREAAARANPWTASRIRRGTSPSNDRPSGQALIDPAVFTTPQEPSARFIVACCRHPGWAVERARANHSLLDLDRRMTQGEVVPQFMLLMGDQIYADATAGVADSPSAVEKVVTASRTAFNTDGMRRILSRVPCYMAIDDHEIAENWSGDMLEGSGPSQTETRRLHATGMASFAAFQWVHSPRNHNAGSFDYGFEASSCDVFVLDARSHRHRAAAAGAARICSARQMAALKAWLNDGSGRLKVLACGSVVVPGLLQHRRDAELRCPAEDADNWQRVPGQRAEILRLLALSTAPAVALVSGDYHCACVSTIRFMRGHELVRQACAVVAPPLYAPYPAINVHPKDVCATESIDLDDGLRAEVRTESWDGNGYAEITATAHPDCATYHVNVAMRVMQWDRRRAPTWLTPSRDVSLSRPPSRNSG